MTSLFFFTEIVCCGVLPAGRHCEPSQPGQLSSLSYRLVQDVMTVSKTTATGRLLILSALLSCALIRVVVRAQAFDVFWSPVPTSTFRPPSGSAGCVAESCEII